MSLYFKDRFPINPQTYTDSVPINMYNDSFTYDVYLDDERIGVTRGTGDQGTLIISFAKHGTKLFKAPELKAKMHNITLEELLSLAF